MTDAFTTRLARTEEMMEGSGANLRQAVATCVSDVLRRNGDQLAHHATLAELGAESLDLLDINYRLERRFGIKMPRRGLIDIAQSGLAGVPRDRLDEAVATRLSALMPEVPSISIAAGMSVDVAAQLLTIESLVRVVAWQLTGRRDEVSAEHQVSPHE